MGCTSGKSDARLARKIRPDVTDEEAFAVGPQLHALEGIVSVKPVKLEMDIVSGTFYGEFIWDYSFEAEEHIREMGLHTGPVCWNQLGYACGYSSEFMGTPILYKEVECVGCGDKQCRIVGKPKDQWDDSEEMVANFAFQSIAETMYSLNDEISQLRSTLKGSEDFSDIIGDSLCMQESLQLLETAAHCEVPLLLLGETGVGKDLFAHTLHKSCARSRAAFVSLNCAAIPHDLFEAELFGVEKGAFTGADKSRPGRFERAHGGILFLDEIGELSESAQAKLLRVLQSGEYERVGDSKTRKVDVRVIAATNASLQQKVDRGEFRADLYYRLNVFPIVIPPLRERKEDFSALTQKFVNRYNLKHRKKIKGLSQKSMNWVQQYPWPGNIRELENVIERGVILCEGEKIELEKVFVGVPIVRDDELKGASQAPNLTPDATQSIWEGVLGSGLSFEAIEQQVLLSALDQADGNEAAAARLLGMRDAQFRYRLHKHNNDS
jgi:transcriptional regulator with GAF, ATPase, and Fis domain